MKISYARLKSGNWGVRVTTDDPFTDLPEEGDVVFVTTKAGKEKREKLGRRIWSGNAFEGDGRTGLYALD